VSTWLDAIRVWKEDRDRMLRNVHYLFYFSTTTGYDMFMTDLWHGVTIGHDIYGYGSAVHGHDLQLWLCYLQA